MNSFLFFSKQSKSELFPKMKLKLSKLKQKFSRPLICRDIARGINFAVITCVSCKMFFRRHAQSQLVR
jgi:hypothetical protein